MNLKQKFKLGVLVVAVVTVVYVLYVTTATWKYSYVDETTYADVAIVLGAGVQNGEPSLVFQERINHAIKLYENGYIEKIIFTGGKSKNGLYSDASIAKNYALEKGVPNQSIYLEEQSTITEENILYASEIIRKNGLSTALLVSDPLHMKRAMRMAKDYGLTVFSSPTQTTRYRTLKTQIPFAAREVFFYIGYEVHSFFYKRPLSM